MQRAQEAQAKKQLEVLKSLVAQIDSCKVKQKEQPKASFTQNQQIAIVALIGAFFTLFLLVIKK